MTDRGGFAVLSFDMDPDDTFFQHRLDRFDHEAEATAFGAKVAEDKLSVIVLRQASRRGAEGAEDIAVVARHGSATSPCVLLYALADFRCGRWPDTGNTRSHRKAGRPEPI